MTLGMQVGLIPDHIVLDGDPVPPPQKGAQPPNFQPMFIVAKLLDGSRYPLSTEVNLGPGDLVLDGVPALPPKRGTAPQFSVHVYRGQMALWMKTPTGTEVDLSPGHIVLDRDSAPSPMKGVQQSPLLRPISTVATVANHSYC